MTSRNENESPARVDVDVDTQIEPVRRLQPARVCPDQQSRIARRILRDLPCKPSSLRSVTRPHSVSI